ncbi:MAG: hypothetical protein ACK4GN_00665 [Runella sp.]
MKKIFLLSLSLPILIYQNTVFAQQKALQEVIVDYIYLRPPSKVNQLLAKNKAVKIILPKATAAVFYRVTVYNRDKVNTWETLYKSLRTVNPEAIAKAGFDFTPYLLEPNGNADIDVYIFNDRTVAEQFDSGKEVSPCQKIENTQSTVGMLSSACRGQEIFIAAKAREKGKVATIKVEVAALADVAEDPINDRFPYSIQNELTDEIAYEISGDRTNWQAFFLPSKKKAEFKLADNQVYLRVSTLDKVTEEYRIDADKKYRLFWNKDKKRVDLSEIPAAK